MRLTTLSHKATGMTLLELMVVMAIISIISQFSTGFSSDFLAANRAENKMYSLHQNMSYARLYAIENRSYVTLCPLEDNKCVKNNWGEQISFFIDNNKSTSLDEDGLILSTLSHTHISDSLEYPRDAITFRPDGTLNGFQNGTFIYCPNKEKANLEGFALTVSQTGRIRIKSTDACQSE